MEAITASELESLFTIGWGNEKFYDFIPGLWTDRLALGGEDSEVSWGFNILPPSGQKHLGTNAAMLLHYPINIVTVAAV